MDHEHFIRIVKEKSGIADDQDAHRATCQTLHTLAQRISPGEADDLAQHLPEQLRDCMTPDAPLEKFHVDEFIRRIEEYLGADHSTAEREARAVLAALYATVGPEEFDDMCSQLPMDFQQLLDDAAAEAPPPQPLEQIPFTGTMTYDEFLRKVAERAELDREAAARAAGHTPGSVSLYVPALDAVFSGDTLAARGPGSTAADDFPIIITSIHDKLFGLPPRTTVYPGHGEPTTIKDQAPYLEEWIGTRSEG